MPHFDANAARLNASRRAREITELRTHSENPAQGPDRVDVLIIGGGVTGTGIALDAATRGLDVLLIDSQDLAFGTSRWSSKLAHGGLRYLATGNVGIARRSAKERGILMETTAPHLTRALAQVTPVQDRYPFLGKIIPRLGFLAGDALRIAAGTSGKTLPLSRTVSKKKVIDLCPAVETSDLRFGYVNNDGQLIDDARLVTALVRTAAGYGARVLTYCKATKVIADGTGGRVTIEDTLASSDGSGTSEAASFDVEAGVVINATGVWAGDLDPQVTVRPSRGTHLVINSAAVGNPTGALTVPVPGHISRYCFILPEQLGRCYIGITDEDLGTDEIPDVPEVPDSDVRFILDVVNQALKVDLTEDDVLGAFAGLRPLVRFADTGDGEGSTADLSREHIILRGKDTNGAETNLVTVTGGKLTEYRLMAEQTVDVVADILRGAGVSTTACVTASTPLIGALNAESSMGVSSAAMKGLPTSLVERFGFEAPAVLNGATVDRPSEPVGTKSSGEPIEVTRAELEFHITHEGALTVGDLLDRRTRIGLIPEDREACEATAQEILNKVLPTLA